MLGWMLVDSQVAGQEMLVRRVGSSYVSRKKLTIHGYIDRFRPWKTSFDIVFYLRGALAEICP